MIGGESMKVFRGLLIAIALIAVLFAVGLGIAWIRTAPAALPEGSESAARLAPGPHPVGNVELEWVDASRPTAANGDYPGSSERSFPVALWYPEGARGEHPLAVYSHGFVSSRYGGTYLAEHLASHGYVVVSADYPLTHVRAPGGPNARDVVHQPADVSFLIDQAMALAGADRANRRLRALAGWRHHDARRLPSRMEGSARGRGDLDRRGRQRVRPALLRSRGDPVPDDHRDRGCDRRLRAQRPSDPRSDA
jgi:hypothetical protein